MARLRPIYVNRAAQQFRQLIRPSLQGNVLRAEPTMAMRMADELFEFLRNIIVETLRVTDLNDDKAELRRQLNQGIRVIGRNSLRTLQGRIDVYPWVFPHEFGGTLEPNNAQYLTVPLYYALRADGTPKYRTAGAWRRWGSFIYTQKSTGRKFIAYKGASGDLRILYILVDQVEIPARLGLNRMGDRMLGTLLASWYIIYVEEAARYGIRDLWERD